MPPPPLANTPTLDVWLQIRYWAIMRVAGAAGSPALTSAPLLPRPPSALPLLPRPSSTSPLLSLRNSTDQQFSNQMMWFPDDVAAHASSCAPRPLHLTSTSPLTSDDNRLEICSATRDCTPTLLLFLHSWGGGMQQLWFESDLSPLRSFPPDVNLVFATSLNAADVISDAVLERLASLRYSGSVVDWIAAVLGFAPAAASTRVVEQQLSQQHRALSPFLYVPPHASPPPGARVHVITPAAGTLQ